MIKAKLKGLELEFEKPEDVVEFLSLMEGAPINQMLVSSKPKGAQAGKNLASNKKLIANRVALPNQLKDFISKIKSIAGSKVTSDELSELFEFKSAKGLGPYISSINRLIERESIDIDLQAIIKRSDDPDENRIWIIGVGSEIEEAVNAASKR
mgnify:CR=1 FL=1